MNQRRKTLLWVALFFVIILALTWQFYSLPDARKRLDTLPLQGPQFIGQELFLTPFEEKFFKGVNVIKRTYIVGSQRLFITALDGTRNRHVVHDPYYCFRGAGWQILSSREVVIPGGTAQLLEIKNEQGTKQAVYWFSDKIENYTSPLTYWIQTTLRRLTLGASGPEPLLIMVQPLFERELDLPALENLFPQLFTF